MWNLTVEFPQVAAWTKYWVALCGDQLYYYPAKSLKATERKHVGHTRQIRSIRQITSTVPLLAGVHATF